VATFTYFAISILLPGALALVPQQVGDQTQGSPNKAVAKKLKITAAMKMNEQFRALLVKHVKKTSGKLQTLVNIFSEAEAGGHVKGPRFGLHGITLKEFKVLSWNTLTTIRPYPFAFSTC
jgi:hypothetical protein